MNVTCVVVLLDANSWERAIELSDTCHVWIPFSDRNNELARQLWQAQKTATPNHAEGSVTLFNRYGDSKEDWLLHMLNPIEDHHGGFAGTESYRVLRVENLTLSDRLLEEPRSHGFVSVSESGTGIEALKNAA